MNKINRIIWAVGVSLLFMGFVSCSDELGPSMFDDPASLFDPKSPTYELDTFLHNQFAKQYNVEVRYRYSIVNNSYNLVPPRIEKAGEAARLIKYVWFDAYEELMGKEFLQAHSPRIIELIGSSAFNPNGGEVGGTAEAGMKVVLYNCNGINHLDLDGLNKYLFHVLYHEFTHILHQKVSYPADFKDLSKGKLNPMEWSYQSLETAAKAGFVSSYSMVSADEDIAEIVGTYIVKSESDWEYILSLGERDGADGKDIILRKLKIATDWLDATWGVDIDKLRAIVHARQASVNSLYN